MAIEDIQSWLIENEGFKKIYNDLYTHSVSCDLNNLITNSDETITEHDWHYLLECASLLAQSEKGECQEVSLRIAQFGIKKEGLSSEIKHASAVVLDMLANKPALNLAIKRGYISDTFQDELNFEFTKGIIAREISNSIILSNYKAIQVNGFQKEFWQKTSVNDWVSVSAPTSAGKSYIVERWLSEQLKESTRKAIVFIVPTRALIQQVQNDIELLINVEDIKNVKVSTLPLERSVHPSYSNVFIFTQERFSILLGNEIFNLELDLIIVDEAHKIGDKERGILLEQSLDIAINNYPGCKVIFCSPLTENPDILLADAPEGTNYAVINRQDVMVNQNLLWVTQVPRKPMIWNVELLIREKLTALGTINLPDRPTPDSKRLPFISFVLSNPNGGNVIYVNGAADAEKTSKQLYGLISEDVDLSENADIKALIELIKKTVHAKYSLLNVLSKGVGFHYGNMPLLIRTEIERLFSLNVIKYLVCTSTLIEGINMPCQNIFLRGPQKGQGISMSEVDFWNLAGRAGRWGKEFQGNVFCIDAKSDHVWKNGSPRSRKKYKIHRSSDLLLANTVETLSFIKNESPRTDAAKKPGLDYILSFLYSSSIRFDGILNAKWSDRYDQQYIQNLENEISTLRRKIKLPDSLILKNPGISPVAMNNLYNYFVERTDTRGEKPESLLPVAPEDENSVGEYAKILYRINSSLANDVFGRGTSTRRIALLIVCWMKGYPLSRIISSREAFYKDRGDSKPIPNLIRDTMSDVEKYARFLAPKYLSCYVDILRHFLTSINRVDLASQLVDLDILLEFGVSQETQLSLIGIGLSRQSAISISEFIADDSYTESQCVIWLTHSNWITNDLPELIKREITDVLSKKISR